MESLFRGAGLLAGEDIDINGASVFNGSMHANGQLDISGAYVQKNEDATMTSGFEVDIPEVDFSPYFDNYDVVELEVVSGNGNNPDYCDFDYGGDLSGAVFYCSANINMGSSSSFSNAVLLSEGDVEQNGAIHQGEDGVDTAILAKGDIRFNGASVVYGWFLSGGM